MLESKERTRKKEEATAVATKKENEGGAEEEEEEEGDREERKEAAADKQRATLLPDRVNYGTISSGRYISLRHRTGLSVFFLAFLVHDSVGSHTGKGVGFWS